MKWWAWRDSLPPVCASMSWSPGNPPGAANNGDGTQVRTVLQNIEVLSAGTDIQKDAEGKPQAVRVVNLLVTPDQAQVLSLATGLSVGGSQGHIQLVLRNPLDTEVAQVAGTGVAQLFSDGVAPAKKVSPPPAGEARAQARPPRLFDRGLQRVAAERAEVCLRRGEPVRTTMRQFNTRRFNTYRGWFLAAAMAGAMLYAQAQPGGNHRQDSANDLSVVVGKSVLLDCANPVERVAVGMGGIAEATAISPVEILINGKAPGETSLIIWEKGGNREFFNLAVRAGLSAANDRFDVIRRELNRQLPGQEIKISGENGAVFLSGTVKDLTSSERAVQIASVARQGGEPAQRAKCPRRSRRFC